MAKRRRLKAPDATDLEQLEAGFAAKPSLNPFDGHSTAPPIAQVAAEAASLSGMAAVTDRVAMAQDQSDAALWRDAQADGMVAQRLSLDAIDADFIRRDRMKDDEEEMEELLTSLREHGLRTPIEVTPSGDGYGLISGFRRLKAFRQLSTSDPRFETIPAFIRDAGTGQGAYVSMVEENELRSNLTPYERGRIAVLAAGQGVFPNSDAAVDILFAAASKAKRSKVRGFAKVHEALGDLLQFPLALSEKAGLRLAAALRDGSQAKLRDALAQADVVDAKSEWAVLDAALSAEPAKSSSRGGRPREIKRLPKRELGKGIMLQAELASDEVRLKISGHSFSIEEVEALVDQVSDALVTGE